MCFTKFGTITIFTFWGFSCILREQPNAYKCLYWSVKNERNNMLLGIFLLITTGLLWVVIGSVISLSACKGKNLDRIQADSALFCILVCVGWLWSTGAHFPSPLITILLILAGAANYFTFLLMNRAMQLGHHGIVWSLVQSALICPFLMGVIFLGVACSPVRIVGIIGILGGIL